MIVQATNTGGDLNHNHFDILLPGGGVGIFNGCKYFRRSKYMKNKNKKNCIDPVMFTLFLNTQNLYSVIFNFRNLFSGHVFKYKL